MNAQAVVDQIKDVYKNIIVPSSVSCLIAVWLGRMVKDVNPLHAAGVTAVTAGIWKMLPKVLPTIDKISNQIIVNYKIESQAGRTAVHVASTVGWVLGVGLIGISPLLLSLALKSRGGQLGSLVAIPYIMSDVMQSIQIGWSREPPVRQIVEVEC